MSNQPVILNIQYTPYTLPKSATKQEIADHAEARSFYDMTGAKNIFSYITTEDKQTGGKRTMFEYLQKNLGVFNDKGMIPQEQVDEMKTRLKNNKGNIYHGFISINEEESHKIDTPEKCIELVKRTFPQFFKDAKFQKDNVDLMCALHLDRPQHLHIHFVFWEKEPTYKDKDGNLQYRRRGKIDKKSIDNLFVRTGLFLGLKKDKLYKSRDRAIDELKKTMLFSKLMKGPTELQKEIVALAKELPKTGRLTYGSKDMSPYRDRVDKIVQLLLALDGRARKADLNFHMTVGEREKEIQNICGTKEFALSRKNVSAEQMEAELPTYHNEIDITNIHIIDDIREDYKRRQGNLVLNLIKKIKPEIFEYSKRKASDKSLKRSLGISRKKVNGLCQKFFANFGPQSELLERDFFNRLQEIEKEIERERSKKKNNKGEDYKD